MSFSARKLYFLFTFNHVTLELFLWFLLKELLINTKYPRKIINENKQKDIIKNIIVYYDDLELCSFFRISNLILEEEDFDVDRIIYKIYNFVIPSSANDFFKMNAEKDPDVENSVKAKAESHELLLCITQNGLKDWLPLDIMTINELGSYFKITQNKLLAESHIDELDEVIDTNSLYYKLKAMSLLILNENLSTSDLQTEFQQVLGGLDIEIGLADIINEIHGQTNLINKRVFSVIYLVRSTNSISNTGGLMRVKEKMIRIVIEQLKHLMGGKVSNFVESFTFLTAITLYNFYHTFKNIYGIWDQFKQCDELSANAREQVYLSTEPINYPNNDYQHREKLAKIMSSLAAMGLSGVSLAVLAALSRNLGNKIENFNKTLDLFKDLNMKLETKKKRRHVKEQEFVENKQFLITEYELLMNEFGAFESEL
ncbi:11198_t:CDS:2 [Entrophospora sp. SA101]|nr:11198_t:CDS:2 [Entrophospora sp. SA101]